MSSTTYATADEMLDLDPPVEPLDGEVWRGVIGLEDDYLISSYGRIWSYHFRRLLQPIGGRRIVLKGRATSVGELVLESHGKQPKPAKGAIAWAEDKTITWPYRLSNLVWLETRAELMAALSELHKERARTLEHKETLNAG